MKTEFLNLGRQPLANHLLTELEGCEEFTYNLGVTFDTTTSLVSLTSFVDPNRMFNETYIYRTSNSYPMVAHFRDAANVLRNRFNPNRVLEIGSNDGSFIQHYDPNNSVTVEPCSNFSAVTEDLGYRTFAKLWNLDLANEIVREYGIFDLIYSANCFCHIPDIYQAFKAIKITLAPEGVFVFEDPSLIEMLDRCSYDQIYDEHAHVFSITALDNILKECGLFISHVEQLDVHGGSNRIFARHRNQSGNRSGLAVNDALKKEESYGLNELETYTDFSLRVEKSRFTLVDLLETLKNQGKKIICYGATSKSATVFNYCRIGDNLLDYIVDSTPEKQGKYSPGMHIPIVSPQEGFDETVDAAFLGAWNFKDVILKKEHEFVERGGLFITHVPEVMICR